jgi:NodT family efflux transporter outer membrane factor (OMF) lipoprotein
VKSILFFSFISLLLVGNGCARIPEVEKNSILEIQNISTEEPPLPLVFKRGEWWKNYDDTNLNELIELVLKENLELKKATLNIKKAEQEINLAKSSTGPFISLNGQIKRERFTENDLTFGATSGDKISNYGKLGFTGSYDVDLFKKYSSLVKAQEYIKIGEVLSSKWVELKISTQVTLLYTQWQFLNDENRSLKERVNILEKLSKLDQKGIVIGINNLDTLLEIQRKLREAEIALEKNNSEQQIVENSLRLLAADKHNEKISKILKETIKKPLSEKNIHLPTEISSEIIKSRPDIEYYLTLIDAQGERLNHYKAGFYPQFTINGMAAYGAYGLDKIFKSSSLAGLIGVGFTFPIFKAGELQSQYRIAGIELNLFIEEYNNTLLQAFQDVNNQLIKLKEAKKIYTFTKKSSEDCYKIYKRNSERNRLGLQSSYETEYSRYQWLEAKIAQQEAEFNLFAQQINLIKALGGKYD